MIFLQFLNVTKFLYIFLMCICLCYILIYFWRKRYFYYYAFQIPGPFLLPFVIIGYFLSGKTQDIIEIAPKKMYMYGSLSKVFLGSKLICTVSKPEYIEIILKNALRKEENYKYFHSAFGNGLITLNYDDVWKRHRKIIARTFSQKILNSFVDIFVEYSNKLCEKVDAYVREDYVDLFSLLSQCSLDIICDTLMDIKVNAMENGNQYILWTQRLADLGMQRAVNIFLQPDFIWKLTSLSEEVDVLTTKADDFVKKVIEEKRKMKLKEGNDQKESKKKFLSYLLELEKNDKWTELETFDEVRTFTVAGSDTIALAVCHVLLMLGMHQEIQFKVQEELVSVFKNTYRNTTIEDLQNLTYLDRVIKESLRLFPIGPFLVRQLSQDIPLGKYILPKDARVIVPIFYLHRDPNLWTEPLKFNPNRFLPEEEVRRKPCSFIPFSFGPKSCIGYKFGFMAIKTILSTILRHYRVSDAAFNSIEEIKLKFDVATKYIEKHNIKLERRL